MIHFLARSWAHTQGVHMSTTLNPEVAALRDKIEEHGKELAEMRGSLNQLNNIVNASVRQSIWQLIALIVSLCLSIAGGFAYQANMIDKRLDQFEKRFEERIDQSEKNITARFEDLKQEVRYLKLEVHAQRK
jgi:chaperonin cofactor prefoldin